MTKNQMKLNDFGYDDKEEKRLNEANNKIIELLDELWEAAVNLRGSIEPPDYKKYVLPIIFLRFLSLRYEKRREELLLMIKNPKSDYYTSDLEVKKQILEDDDEYRAVNAFIVPKKARWSFILKNAQEDDIKIKLDDALEILEKTYPEKLRGFLPKIFAGSNLSRENVTGLINLFSKYVFKSEYGGEDLIGRVYEYFIGQFASSEGKRGGEFFTPSSIVKTLVRILNPDEGVVFDPCCGSGGMFVQSDIFTKHNRKLSFFGVESKEFTYRLCRMNLFIHRIDGNIKLGNSYKGDCHAHLKADFILANPPFNDGSKGKEGWGAKILSDKDPRLVIGRKRMPIASKNANTMWMMHFLHHLKDGGTAGFVMATGELSNSIPARLEVRKALIENGYLDCIVRMPGQLFANTPIPCSLWIISKNKDGKMGSTERKNKVLFINARKFGTLLPGSRKQKFLSIEEINKISSLYNKFKLEDKVENEPGFCKVVNIEDIKTFEYNLTPGRYVGIKEIEEDEEYFEEKMKNLRIELIKQMKESNQLEKVIVKSLEVFKDGG